MTQKSQPWRTERTFQEEKIAWPGMFAEPTEVQGNWCSVNATQRGSQSCANLTSQRVVRSNSACAPTCTFYSGSQGSIFSTEVMWYNMYFRKITLSAEWTIGFGTARKWRWKKMKVIAMVKPRKDGRYNGLSCVSPKFLCWSSNRTPAPYFRMWLYLKTASLKG